MSQNGRLLGLAAATLMFVFSAWMYGQTGDWVAAVFAAGSLAYGVFFFSRDDEGSS